MSTSLENAVRAERATEWFDQAYNQVLVAKRIPHKRELKPQVIFHLGQAMEMFKSLRLALQSDCEAVDPRRPEGCSG